jgi:four helix bundle protein
VKIQKFEDLEIWKEARNYVRNIYFQTGRGNFSRDYGLRDQIRRASVSVLGNIAEGFERKTKNEFIQFLFIAKAPAANPAAIFMLHMTSNTLKKKILMT